MPPPAESTVERFDVSALSAPTRTPQGFLRVSAYLTRAGVFRYTRADGSVVREYRPQSEVFAPASLRSLASAPVTDLHPAEMVSPKNVRRLAIGHVSETARQDGTYVAGVITVEDESAIGAVERGDRREVSMGYRCRLDATPGVFEGEPYDCVQRSIEYNHAAIGPSNWGRAGREVRLHLDGADGDPPADDDAAAFRLDGEAALLTETIDAPRERSDRGDDDMDVATIRVDGIDVQVPKQWSQLLEKALTTRDAQVQQLTAARDALQGRADGLTAEVATLKAELATANEPARLDDLVSARTALIGQARRVLDADYAYEGKTPRQVHEAVLVKLDSKFVPTGRSDEYIGARFDQAIETLPADSGGTGTGTARKDGLGDARRTATDPHRGAGGGQPQHQQPRTDSLAPRPAWQTPLAMTKDRSS